MAENAEERDYQAALLSRFRREGGLLAVWLVSGKRLIGRLKGYDRFTIVLEHDHKQTLVYKHAVTTISPERPIRLHNPETGAEEE